MLSVSTNKIVRSGEVSDKKKKTKTKTKTKTVLSALTIMYELNLGKEHHVINSY